MPHLSTFEHMPPSGFCWLFVRWNQASEREGAFASTLGYSSTRVPSVITADQMQQRIANVQWYDSTHFPKCGASRKRRRNWGLAVTCLTEFALDTLHTERQFADHSSPFASGCFVAATTAFAGAVTLKCWQRFESLLPRLWPCPRVADHHCGSPIQPLVDHHVRRRVRWRVRRRTRRQLFQRQLLFHRRRRRRRLWRWR